MSTKTPTPLEVHNRTNGTANRFGNALNPQSRARVLFGTYFKPGETEITPHDLAQRIAAARSITYEAAVDQVHAGIRTDILKLSPSDGISLA